MKNMFKSQGICISLIARFLGICVLLLLAVPAQASPHTASINGARYTTLSTVQSYARIDLTTNEFKGTNSIANGYPGVPFTTIDAAYVDQWHYNNTPQLYLFSGTQYARIDLTTNEFKGTNSIANGYPGIPFTTIDAAYVDQWHYNNTPQLYLFSGTQYARIDLTTNEFKGTNSIANGYPGVPFTTIDAAYVDQWHYNNTPQLYLFGR